MVKNKVADVSAKDVLDQVWVRISAKDAEYVPLHNKDGWFLATGTDRVPTYANDIKTLLEKAVRRGCVLFATAGGIRVMASTTGKGGVFFVEKKSLVSGDMVYLMPPANAEKAAAAGLVVAREGPGVYVKPRDAEGNVNFGKMSKFTNNNSPIGWEEHPWKGFVGTPSVETHIGTRKVKKEDKVVTKTVEKKLPEKTASGKVEKTKIVVKTGKKPQVSAAAS